MFDEAPERETFLVRTIRTTPVALVAWFGPEDGPRAFVRGSAAVVAVVVVSLVAAASVPIFGGVLEQAGGRGGGGSGVGGSDGEQAEERERELSRATVNTTTSKGLLRWRERVGCLRAYSNYVTNDIGGTEGRQLSENALEGQTLPSGDDRISFGRI